MTIYLPGITKDNYFNQKEITEDESLIFKSKLNYLLNLINESISTDSPGGNLITEEELNEISVSFIDLINSIKVIDPGFPELDIEKLVSDTIKSILNPVSNFFRPKPLISMGIGFTWIPFYNYETFAGLILRPMLSVYLFGLTIRGGLTYFMRKVGTFHMFIMKFNGLFINLGNVGVEKIIGPTIYIGVAGYIRS